MVFPWLSAVRCRRWSSRGRGSATAGHRQLPLAAPFDRAARPDRAGLRRWRNQHGHRQANGADGDDGRQVAQAVSGAGPGRPARRAPPWPAAHLRGRHGGRGDQPGPADQAPRRQHPLERPLSGCGNRDLQNHRSPLAADLLGAAPPAEARSSSPPIPSSSRRSATSSACT